MNSPETAPGDTYPGTIPEHNKQQYKEVGLMEKKLYQALLLAIATEGISTDDAKELIYTLLPAIFTGLCTKYEITEKEDRYSDAILFLKMASDRALDYFVDYEPEEQTFQEV